MATGQGSDLDSDRQGQPQLTDLSGVIVDSEHTPSVCPSPTHYLVGLQLTWMFCIVLPLLEAVSLEFPLQQ